MFIRCALSIPNASISRSPLHQRYEQWSLHACLGFDKGSVHHRVTADAILNKLQAMHVGQQDRN